jgi:DNA-binding PadR family transcriptional regulator
MDEAHLKILQDVAAFARIRKYRGMLPSKLALFYDEGKIQELLAGGCLERIHVTYACGSETTFYKLTDKGQDCLKALKDKGLEAEPAPAAPHPPPPAGAEARTEDEELSKDQLILLGDIYHSSQMHRHGGVMPADELEHCQVKDLNTLFGLGYIIRVKVETGSGQKRKGYILSDKGLRYLQPG